MSKVNSFLTNRLKSASEKLSKMTGLAELSSQGQLSSFAGVFRLAQLSAKEQEALQTILKDHAEPEQDITSDLRSLLAITSEVKAINNQAAILHGERIKKAQEILKRYRDGAFTNWLISTYGNRQTPYNFLQYYELYNCLPNILHTKLDEMPRQAVYTLASRNGPLEKKEEIIKNYQGEPKQELLKTIRATFPLDKEDKRASDLAEGAIALLVRLESQLKDANCKPTAKQKEKIQTLLNALLKLSK